MDWFWFIIAELVGLLIGFVAGYFYGLHCGWSRSTSYYSGYRHEDSEIINRLRGRIIWLEKSVNEAIEMSQDVESKAAMLRGRLERVENEP